jgi:SAM-dependent methyltransferase
MIWQFRLARNFAYALAPFPQTLRRLKRSVSPRAPALDLWTVTQGLRQVALVRDSGGEIDGRTVLVFGTMLRPALPLLFALAGARRVLMLDRGHALDRDALVDTAERLAEHAAQIAPVVGASPEVVRAALAPPAGESFAGLLERFHLDYRPKADPEHLDVPDGSVDVIASRAALEHMPPQAVARALAESRRVLAPDGRVCHVIDNSDHWSHGDPDISAVNFLRYPDWAWPLIVLPPGDYQNRLRHVDYVRMLRHAGFAILLDPSVPDPVAVAAVRAMRVARRFRKFAPGQLGVITSYLVAAPAARERT